MESLCLLAGRKFYPDFIWRLPPGENRIALTFDDGPEPEVTEKVLEILTSFHVKATFFCLGYKAEQNPGLIETIARKGHTIGNHSYSHPDGSTTFPRRYIEDVHKASRFLPGSLFRPPYGRILPFQASELKKHFRIVMWDVMSNDFRRSLTPADCVALALTRSSDGSILVFHDTIQAAPRLIPALPEILHTLISMGFLFSPLHEEMFPLH